MTEARRTLGEVVGRNLRSYREQYGWSQDHVARMLRVHGLGWTRTQLAKVERGERPVSFEELLLVSIALGPGPAFFVTGPADEWVTLSDETAVRPRALAAMLSGKKHRPSDVKMRLTQDRATDPAWPELTGANLTLADADAEAEPEQKAADKLGVDPVIVARASWVTWGKSFSEERDYRVSYQAPGAEARTVQAVRGHVTRDLLNELREVIAERTTKKARSKR
jgi:transcriptional regulator with XRE-family HTH domain